MLPFLLSIADEKDHAKIEYLYHHYNGDMLRFAKHRLRLERMPNWEMDAEDAVQNAFLKITKYIDKIDFTVGEKGIRAYVLKIVSNEVSSIVADYTYLEDIDEYKDTLEDGDFFEQLRIHERYDEVVQEIGWLDETYSIPLSLRYGDKMGITEIANLMGLSEKAVYTRLGRAKRLLVERLHGKDENE